MIGALIAPQTALTNGLCRQFSTAVGFCYGLPCNGIQAALLEVFHLCDSTFLLHHGKGTTVFESSPSLVSLDAVMGLCEVCRKIDIRKLLQTAVSLDHIKGHVNEQNQCPCCILHEYGIPHHDTYAALKTASGYGCEFCQLIRHSLIEQECGNDISKEEAKWDFNPVFIVPWKHKAPSPRKNEPPFLEIRVESRPTCKDFISLEFEAAAPRGVLIQGQSSDNRSL